MGVMARDNLIIIGVLLTVAVLASLSSGWLYKRGKLPAGEATGAIVSPEEGPRLTGNPITDHILVHYPGALT